MGGRLISGHDSGKLRVWSVATGECDQVLEGHEDTVLCVGCVRVASGERLSGRVHPGVGDGCWWRADGRAIAAWLCSCGSVACGWQDKVASGYGDGSIRVWDVGSGAREAKLTTQAE